MVDLGRYTIVLDGGEVGTVARGESVEIEIRPGAHTLELSYSARRRSAVATFSIRAGGTAAFACSPPSIPVALPRLVTSVLLGRGFWIDLGPAGHTETVGDGTSSLDGSEQDGALIKTIQAGQANQPGIRR